MYYGTYNAKSFLKIREKSHSDYLSDTAIKYT